MKIYVVFLLTLCFSGFFSLNLAQGQSWTSPWKHNHFSTQETPFVHSFSLEPAFLGRELFFNYSSSQEEGSKESELEMELEWAFTQRLGLVIEAPVVYSNLNESPAKHGVGDVAAAARALLIHTDFFLMAGNLEISLPSGNESQGFGSGEVHLSPSFSFWYDLGQKMQVQAQTGVSRGVESGNLEYEYGASLAYVFSNHDHSAGAHVDEGHAGKHSTSGVTSGIVEYTDESLLVGISHNVSEMLEVRGGISDANSFIFGIVVHF
jgi:hypothetical protein